MADSALRAALQRLIRDPDGAGSGPTAPVSSAAPPAAPNDAPPPAEAGSAAPAALPPLPDDLPAGLFVADEDGRLLAVNARLAAWLGHPAAELTGRRFGDFVEDAVPEAEGEGDEAGRLVLAAADGSTFPAYLVQVAETAADDLRVRGVIVRLPETPAAAPAAAGDAAERPIWLFESAPVGIALLDMDGTVREANPALGRLLGLPTRDLVGLLFAEMVAEEDRSEVAAVLSKIAMATARAAHLDIRMPAADGRDLAASLYASPRRDRAGAIKGLVLHFIDATEHKNLELQFAQSQKMQAVGQLAGGVAHDFNNLLTAMIGFADLLLMRHGPDDPDFADIMQIKQNANRATNLVRQLLAFSRKQNLEPVVLDVTEALGDLSNLLGRLLGETVELEMVHGRGVGRVRVDKGQFDQVVINLSVNARDAMAGGGILTIRTESVALDHAVSRQGDVVPPGRYVRVDVSDTGTGIAKENLDRIFEPFFSTKEVGAGTGLGLSTVHGIIHQSDGYIFVDSALGEGTTFSILLPEVEEEGAAATATHPARQPRREGDLTGSGRVLLVEDEDAVRLFGMRALASKGYTVLEARDGEEALEVIGREKERGIDLIVSDVIMPGLDGHTLVKLVRHELPHVKVILMSGYAEDVFQDEIDRDPSVHFLGKPFTLKGLAQKVKDVLAE